MTAAVASANFFPQNGPNWTAIAVVVLLHALLLWGVVQLNQTTQPEPDPEPMRVRLIQPPPQPKEQPEPKPEPKPKPKPEPEKTPPITSSKPEPAPEHTAPPPKPEPKPKPEPQPKPAPPPEPQPTAPTPPPRNPVPLAKSGLVPVVRVPPVYPRTAKLAGMEGYVTLQFTVRPNGTVANVMVINAEPPVLFNESAKEAVRQWRFQAPLVDGEPVSVAVRQTIRFELE